MSGKIWHFEIFKKKKFFFNFQLLLCTITTLKVLIFARFNFRENKFLRDLIREILRHSWNILKIKNSRKFVPAKI